MISYTKLSPQVSINFFFIAVRNNHLLGQLSRSFLLRHLEFASGIVFALFAFAVADVWGSTTQGPIC